MGESALRSPWRPAALPAAAPSPAHLASLAHLGPARGRSHCLQRTYDAGQPSVRSRWVEMMTKYHCGDSAGELPAGTYGPSWARPNPTCPDDSPWQGARTKIR